MVSLGRKEEVHGYVLLVIIHSDICLWFVHFPMCVILQCIFKIRIFKHSIYYFFAAYSLIRISCSIITKCSLNFWKQFIKKSVAHRGAKRNQMFILVFSIPLNSIYPERQMNRWMNEWSEGWRISHSIFSKSSIYFGKEKDDMIIQEQRTTLLPTTTPKKTRKDFLLDKIHPDQLTQSLYEGGLSISMYFLSFLGDSNVQL